ncbi:MarR family winged helix-turn-helix transcriptional regulator [Streptacidiphilus rugosus]|uniref:MarR family winged helix-turn-helix transcriptional regulator n=1 Tax=Streptacidiphilus rugosus TaxID=405783 RepID=UPI00056D8421|nr:MarR family transcriptional regulator [Streptacidiphilus rugosus]
MLETSNGLRAHLGYWLRRLSDEVDGRFERELAKQGVTVAQWKVMSTIDRGDAVTTGDVARFLGIDASAVSRLVDRLVLKGLMVRNPDPASRRSMLLALTGTGSKLVPRLAQIAEENEAYFFDSLAEEQRTLLVDCIRTVLAGTESAGA